MNIKLISYIIPCYNESEVLQEFYRRVSDIAKKLEDYNFEFVFVNDGSQDDTSLILNGLASADKRVKVIHFSRNFGHQYAITAGMDFCKGDLIITIDADLQDPPELVEEILKKAKDGYDVIHAQRYKRKGETWFKLATAWFFYKMMNKLTDGNIIENSGDFRGFTRPVLKTISSFRERHRFMRGMFSIVGFKQCTIQYDRDERYAGETKYPLDKMVKLALNAVFSFSSAPIKLISWFALLSWVTSLIYLIKALMDHFIFKLTVPGWTSIIILLTFFMGIIIFCLSIIASYIGRIFDQGQDRPLYWINDVKNIDSPINNNFIREVKLFNASKNED